MSLGKSIKEHADDNSSLFNVSQNDVSAQINNMEKEHQKLKKGQSMRVQEMPFNQYNLGDKQNEEPIQKNKTQRPDQKEFYIENQFKQTEHNTNSEFD